MERNYKSTINHRLPEELVCMVSDDCWGSKNLAVPIEDKTYYGCSENCLDTLHNYREFRYSMDPLTNETVNKVGAYIVRKSDLTHAVYYFKSKENYEKYEHEKSS